jgi:seryl-tRNA synthetase
MLDVKLLRQDLDRVKKELEKRGRPIAFDAWVLQDAQRRNLLVQRDELRRQQKIASDKIGEIKRSGQPFDAMLNAQKSISDQIKSLEDQLEQIESSLEGFLLTVPNLPHSSVPVGKDETENQEVSRWGTPPSFKFQPKPHWELGECLDILDFKRAAKITGSRFTLYKGLGARLERAVINFMLDLHTKEHGYQEVLPPFLVNRSSMTNTGQLPKFEEDLFRLKDEDYFLVPTGEVPVTNIHKDETFEEEELPVNYVASTPCFRREAGSYGKDVKGLIRQHQFNKVELVKFVKPEISYDELESLLLNAEEVLRRLNLHYRVVALCTGDLSLAASKTYDIEVWMPGQSEQGKYKEISSCSNFESFQSRRGAIRYRPKSQGSKPEYVHTLNGSGLAVGRTVAAILENYQQADGSVIVPQALRPYMDGEERISKR